MNHKLILNNISKHISLDKEEEKFFISLLESRKVKRKEFLLQTGDICRHSAFVTDGCMRAYTIDENGFEHILQFAPPDWWIADMYSLITQKPGNLFIEAMEESEMLLLPKEEQEKLYVGIPKFERFFRIITENSLVSNRQRVMDNLSLTAKQRYEKFCSAYPTVFNTIPQKHIAAYIGVTPEFLSKLKAERERQFEI
ncbi:MAG: Crp/Fnr family transcriptional regulator [Ignavibacteria bacterium]|nr:Crp/Fnr family transcriptional regulator [Ignavibacteria bacterium]MBK9225633.1 Crp/Fnr family transcriptional regulator [Ignavibacteria bacterium]